MGVTEMGKATVYQKHRTLQNRKMTYRVWHLPGADKQNPKYV